MNIARFLRTPILKKICGRLFVNIMVKYLDFQVNKFFEASAIICWWRKLYTDSTYNASWVNNSFSTTKYLVVGTHQKQLLFKIGVLKNFAIFTGKHLCRSIFLIKLQGWNAATLFKRLQHSSFSVNIANFFKSFFIEHLWWLLLTHAGYWLYAIYLGFLKRKNKFKHFMRRT